MSVESKEVKGCIVPWKVTLNLLLFADTFTIFLELEFDFIFMRSTDLRRSPPGRRGKKRKIFGEGKSDDGQTERQTNSVSSCALDPFENESCTWSAHKKSSNESCLCLHQCWFFEVTWGEFLPFLSYWHWTYPPTAIRDYSRSPLIFVCENFGQEVIPRTSVPFGMNVNKTQCRICKRLAGHISSPFLV